jgi:uncharacterized repeat protein (TIGR03803 family)
MNLLSRSCSLVLLALAATTLSPAQTFTAIANFNTTVGYEPMGSLVQRADGNFYGTAYQGSFRKSGSVYKVTPSGTLSLVHYFCSRTGCADGMEPVAGLIVGLNGDYYGTTTLGGPDAAAGTIFDVAENGTVFTLHSFDGTDGGDVSSPLIVGADGNYYGTTANFGGGFGTVFKMDENGNLTTLHSFIGSDGANPFGGLVQGTDGNFYGTTTNGGDYTDCGDGCGTIFKMTPSGTLTTLHMFNGADGFNPYDSLVQASNGHFYGTTFGGGTGTNCIIGCGTVFEITPSGALSTLHNFNGTDGGNSFASLIQATDGNLYGTTNGNSVNTGAVVGTIFKMTLGGTLSTLYDFRNGGGEYPEGALVQGTDGNLYGTTTTGGSNFCGAIGCGTVFKITTGLSPFVETIPTSGGAARRVVIYGNNLKGATSVTFNGTTATFKVVSPTEITTTVPPRATTGAVQVVTATGAVLTSNLSFQVP